MEEARKLKPVEWIRSSLSDLRQMPRLVQREIGMALGAAQRGEKHPHAKPLKGFGGASVLEIVADYDSDTYRGVYTVQFAGVIYVLHVFQKKSTRGIATRKRDLALIQARLVDAREDYAAHYAARRKREDEEGRA